MIFLKSFIPREDVQSEIHTILTHGGWLIFLKILHFPSMNLAPCFIGLWSIYNNAFILLSWAFIRMYLEIFNLLSQTWAHNIFITFGLFSFHFIIIIIFFEVAHYLEYIVTFLSKSMKFSSFWARHTTKRPKIREIHILIL